MAQFTLRDGQRGVAVLFQGKRSEAAMVFIAGRDTEDTVKEITKKFAEDGLTPITAKNVVRRDGAWVPFTKPLNITQMLRRRQAWKVA